MPRKFFRSFAAVNQSTTVVFLLVYSDHTLKHTSYVSAFPLIKMAGSSELFPYAIVMEVLSVAAY